MPDPVDLPSDKIVLVPEPVPAPTKPAAKPKKEKKA